METTVAGIGNGDTTGNEENQEQDSQRLPDEPGQEEEGTGYGLQNEGPDEEVPDNGEAATGDTSMGEDGTGATVPDGGES